MAHNPYQNNSRRRGEKDSLTGGGIPRWAEADERCSARTCGAEDTPHPAAAGQAPHIRQFPSAGDQVARRWYGLVECYRPAGGHRLFTANDPEPTGIARFLSGVRYSQSGCRTMRNGQ
jgi:hypothetical protein